MGFYPLVFNKSYKTVDGITYDVYTHSDANTHAGVELWVQQEIVML